MKPIYVTKQEKAEILKQLSIYGIKEIPFILIKSGQDKIRAFSGSLAFEELANLLDSVFWETIGIYFAKIDGNDIRLSVDACHLLKEQIKHKIIQLNDEQFENYMKGREPEINNEQEKLSEEKIYYILKHKDDILGMAKIVQGVIKNYLPKERRRKS